MSRMVYWIFFVAMITRVCGEFNPNVTVKSCANSEVTLLLSNVPEGGLLYIQGRSSACKHLTTGYPQTFTFNFGLCNLEYDSVFRLVVQKKTSVQTGHDKVIPIICVLDMSDIVVNEELYPGDGDDDLGQNKTEKPRALMRILSSHNDVSEGEVMLNDPLALEIELEDKFKHDFDITAKECTAAMIPLIQSECTLDSELFPNFEKNERGDIVSNFRAFQPTDLAGNEEVDVAYTCQIAVCKGSCLQRDCTFDKGREKRNVRNEIERLTVGTRIRIKSPTSALRQEKDKTNTELCVEKILAFGLCIVTGIVLIGSWIVIAYLASRLVTSGIKPDLEVARSVGRRLSSMLNIPQGYNLKKGNNFDAIPEEEGMTPPHIRRKSISVMRVGAIDA